MFRRTVKMKAESSARRRMSAMGSGDFRGAILLIRELPQYERYWTVSVGALTACSGTTCARHWQTKSQET